MNSKQNAINVKSRLIQTAEAGYFTGGPIPFGYESVACDPLKKNSRKKLVICEKEAEIVRNIFQLSLNGTVGKGFGVKAISKYLNDNSILNRGSKWTTNSIHRILSSTTYIGEFVFGKNRSNADVPKVIVPVPAIIDKKMFNSVKQGLKQRDLEQIHVKSIRSNSLLTGLLKCGICGKGMMVATGKSGRYTYYACTKKIKSGVSLCNSKWVPKRALEEQVEEAIIEHVVNKEFIQSIIGEVKSTLTKNNSQSEPELLKLSRKLKLIQQKLDNTYDQIAMKQDLMDDSYAEYLAGLQNQRSELQGKIETIKAQGRLLLRKFGEKQIDNFVGVIRRVFKELDNDSKKALYLNLLKEVRVYPNKITISGSKLGMLNMVSKTKEGTSELVPSFVSMWRRDRDLKAISARLKHLFYNELRRVLKSRVCLLWCT